MRHLMGFGVSKMVLAVALIFTVSCGAKINARKSMMAKNELSFLLIEKQCADGQIDFEPVSTEITRLYSEFQANYTLSFFIIPPRLYDYKSPLIINLNDLSISLAKIKNQISDESYLQSNATAIAVELHYLYQSAMRFEGNKCAFPSLVTKKGRDLRPFLAMRDFCKEKENSVICSPGLIEKLSVSDAHFVEQNTVKMCQAFNASSVNCQAQYTIQKQNNKTGTLVGMYQKRFAEEHFKKLFVLRDSHLKFSCMKDEEKTIMNLKVFSTSWDPKKLEGLLRFVSESWSRGNFKLNIEQVTEWGSDVIEIIPSNSPVSRVPDDNNRQVYLSQFLDFTTSQRVLAHEFGHVLGFPDCYTEFFDNQTKDLIYYEISAQDTNLMCSLKTGVFVPDNYLAQLAQNSCLFN